MRENRNRNLRHLHPCLEPIIDVSERTGLLPGVRHACLTPVRAPVAIVDVRYDHNSSNGPATGVGGRGGHFRSMTVRRKFDCDLLVRVADPVDVYRPSSGGAAIMWAKSIAAVALMPGMGCW